jgi:hypothetical protein
MPPAGDKRGATPASGSNKKKKPQQDNGARFNTYVLRV